MHSKIPKQYKYGIMLLLKSTIVIFAVVTFMLCLFMKYSEAAFPRRGNLVLALLYFSILLNMMTTYSCFRIGKVRLKELSFSYLIALLMTNFFSYLILSLIAEKLLNPIPLLIITSIQLLFGILVYIIANSLYSILFSARDALLVCGNHDYDVAVLEKMKTENNRFDIKQVIDDSCDFNDIKNRALLYSTMIIGSIDENLKSKLVEFCFVNEIQLYTIPTINDIVLQSSNHTSVSDTLLLFCRNQAPSLEQRIVKRSMDIFVSLILLLISSPIMLIVALIIKLYDRGPVFYKQKRYTYNSKVFNLIKFRSMIVDAENDGPQYAVDNDPRVTPIGRFIRAIRIDELPQLFNILLGDMSLVGPRPERIEIVDEYASTRPEFKYRLKVKAGLTGYAQVYGKYNTSFEDKARMDIYYIANYSLLLDIKLILYTIKIIFSKESTDGFEESASKVKISAPKEKAAESRNK